MWPAVSYVMPALDEEEHIEAAIQGMFEQDYEGPVEIVVALGPSADRTDEVVAELARRDERIRTVANPDGGTPAGLNAAIIASQHDIIIRVDAHSILSPNYARIAVQTLHETGAVNVGGIMNAVGRTGFEKAVAHAYGSRLGLGGSAFHIGGRAGPVETVYLGVFRRDALFAVGLFDEGLNRGQDWDLNQRLRADGGVVWFTPQLSVTYRPRSSWSALRRQFYATGAWRSELARRFAASRSARYLAPPALVVILAVGIVLGLIGVATATSWLAVGWLPLVAYGLGVVAASVRVAAAVGLAAGAWSLLVLPTIHLAWGWGFLLGSFGWSSLLRKHST